VTLQIDAPPLIALAYRTTSASAGGGPIPVAAPSANDADSSIINLTKVDPFEQTNILKNENLPET